MRLAQTFTYGLPLALREETRVGARLLVPFGRTLTTGYVVALHEELDPALGLDQSEIKEAEELLDAVPLLTPEVLEITRWISDYYAAPWGEVLKAALPAGLNAGVDQVVTITPEGRDELARLPERKAATAKGRLLQLAVAADGSIDAARGRARVGAGSRREGRARVDAYGLGHRRAQAARRADARQEAQGRATAAALRTAAAPRRKRRTRVDGRAA